MKEGNTYANFNTEQNSNGRIPQDSLGNPNGPGSPEALEKAKFIPDLKVFKELDRLIETYDVLQTENIFIVSLNNEISSGVPISALIPTGPRCNRVEQDINR